MNLKIAAQGFANLIVRRYVGPFWHRRIWLNKTQWLSKEELAELQLVLLKRMVYHAERYVPYYQTLMKEKGITTADIHSLDDINLLPILTKQQVLAAGESLHSHNYQKWMLRYAHTGGTTGTPMNIYRSPFSIGTEHAFVRRQWDWAGIKMSDKTAYLTGRIIVPPDQTTGNLYTYDPFMKELILSTYHLNEANANKYIKRIETQKCIAIVGYPSAIHFLAQVYKESSQKKLTIKAIMTSSETLSDTAKKSIEDAFNCQVYDFYGSAERVCYIFTCEKGHYHVQPEYGYTEFIPVESGSNVCHVISTGFWNYAMPFIRYDLGDIVIRSDHECGCGRKFPCIERIDGRSGDIIRTASGREFGSAILTHLLYGTNNIIESQINQDKIDHIRIDYVPNKQFCENDMVCFKNLIEKHLPTHEIKVEFNRVYKIERTISGKLRPVISTI